MLSPAAQKEFAQPPRAKDGSLLAEPIGQSRLLAIIGSWTFMLSMAAGFLAGIALIPLGSDEIRGAIIAVGAIGIVAGTARRAFKAETKAEALRQQLLDETSYHAFVDAAVEGFFRTTREGQYLIVNPALAEIYGYDSPGQLTCELTDIAQSLYVDPTRRDDFKILMAKNRIVQDFVSQIRRRDGSIIWITENARAVTDEEGQFLYYEGTVADITTKIESELAMRQALQETQEAARAKAAFLAAMSHELKTPLNAVIGFSDVMKQEIFGPVEPPRYRGYVEDILDNGKRLLAMINNILDLSRIESRQLSLEEMYVYLPEAVESARKSVLAGVKESAAVHISVSDSLPQLRADSRRLSQALAHILSNAVKFTPHAGRIDVHARLTAEGGIVIAIADTGIGMAADRIQHALEPFKQLDGSLARRFEGAGLGLPLANALVRLHGGSLAIASKTGEGTTVTLEFPPDRTIMTVLAGTA